MATKGCYICSKRTDKFYLWATPDGKKYKVCSRCINLAKALAANTAQETEKDEPENEN